MLTVLDLFSGIGAFSLGLERAGMKTISFCEVDPFCRRVLAKHWPEVPILENIETAEFPAADIITGGFPCQDALPYGASTNLQLAAHAAQRLANACSALAIDDTQLPVKAMADAAWCMEKMARRMGSKLQDCINRKMAINRRRRWKLDGSGHGYHIGETAAA